MTPYAPLDNVTSPNPVSALESANKEIARLRRELEVCRAVTTLCCNRETDAVMTDNEFRQCSTCSRPSLCNMASECYVAFENRGMRNAWPTSTGTARTVEELVDDLYAEGQKLGAHHYNLLTEAADRLYELKSRLEWHRKPWWKRIWIHG